MTGLPLNDNKDTGLQSIVLSRKLVAALVLLENDAPRTEPMVTTITIIPIDINTFFDSKVLPLTYSYPYSINKFIAS
jgi:hypothetical protein